MSYKTNPALNRLKVIKGWKNPYLPTKTLNYTRDVSLWFKVYILLKIFLSLKKIQLLSCEFRFSHQNQKILYLVINKKKILRKKKKKKVFLKSIRTPLRKRINSDSIFYLYQNLNFLKKTSFWNHNGVHKKILSRFWLTKPKFATWINTLETIHNSRQILRKNFRFLQKNKNFNPVKHFKFKFYTNKQKLILAQKLKIKKRNFVLYAKLVALSQEQKSQFLQQVITNLIKQIDKNKKEMKKINKIYKFLFLFNKNFSKKDKKNKKDISSKKLIHNQFQKKKLAVLKKSLKNQFYSLYSLNLTRSLLKINRFFFSSILLKNFKFLITHISNRRFLNKNKDFKKVLKIKTNQNNIYEIYLWYLFWISKKRNKQLSKKFKIKLKTRIKAQVFKNYLSFSKKKKKKLKFRIKAKGLKKKKKKTTLFKQVSVKQIFVKKLKKITSAVKKKKVVSSYKYRIPYRKNYFDFLQFTTKLKLKYLIQDFIQKYFSFHVETKIIHFLNSYKNQKYLRLVFPVWKKKKKFLIKKFRIKNSKQKNIFLTSQLQLVTSKKNNNNGNQKIQKNQKKLFIKKKLFRFLKKKKVYLLTQKKTKNLRIQNSFKRFKGNKDFRQSFKYFVPTLIYFTRTLNPQPLADLLTKVLYKAKKQTWMLNTIKDLLKLIDLGRNVGYKITLTGRINSSDKSRSIYIIRKNIPLQVFDKNMNFAYSQAKARIGVFGIKIWVYF